MAPVREVLASGEPQSGWLCANRLTGLELFTLIYLSVPWFLFLIFWLKPELALMGTILLAMPLVHEAVYGAKSWELNYRWANFLVIAIAVLWWVFSGVVDMTGKLRIGISTT